jgi:hypothetical protein
MRTTRSEEVAVERRKRDGIGGIAGQRLAVPESILDHTRFRYRWINDDAGQARIFAKTKEDDWDIVANDGDVCQSADLGNAVTRIVGTAPDGSALKSYLCRKPRRFYDEDKAKKSAELDRQTEQLRRGNARDGSSQADYVPHSGIRMT